MTIKHLKIINLDKGHSYIIPENDQPHKSHIEYIEKQTLSVFRVFPGHTEPLEVTQKTQMQCKHFLSTIFHCKGVT